MVKETKGKKKIAIDFIQDCRRRNSTFSKRKKGVVALLEQIETLTDADYFFLVKSSSGRVFCQTSKNLCSSGLVDNLKNKLLESVKSIDYGQKEEVGDDCEDIIEPEDEKEMTMDEEEHEI